MSFEVSLKHQVGDRDIALDFTTTARSAALVGPSGVGKTTVLHCIAGLIRPDRGRIVIAGEVLFDAAHGIDLPPERRGAGYVFQDMRLFPHLSVAANLAYGRRRAAPGDHAIARDEVVALLGLENLLERSPRALSGGEQRRVAIGRALLAGPHFLLLDEPFSSLDAPRAEPLRALVERIGREFQIPILLVSHDRADVAQLAKHVVALD